MKYLIRFISGIILVLVVVAGAAYAYLAPESKPAPVASNNTLIALGRQYGEVYPLLNHQLAICAGVLRDLRRLGNIQGRC
jgi:hypothetical protein